MRSCFLLLFFGSDLSSGVGDLHSDLLGTLDDFGSFLNDIWGTRELTL